MKAMAIKISKSLSVLYRMKIPYRYLLRFHYNIAKVQSVQYLAKFVMLYGEILVTHLITLQKEPSE